MSDTDTYDTRVQAIRDSNQPILDSFQAWLEQSGLTDKTIKSYLSHIRLFAEYLVYYDDPLKKLDQAHSGDVRTFLSYWFPRKVGWTSVTTVKINLVSFKKFFQSIVFATLTEGRLLLRNPTRETHLTAKC